MKYEWQEGATANVIYGFLLYFRPGAGGRSLAMVTWRWLRQVDWRCLVSGPMICLYLLVLGVYLANGRAISFVDTAPARHLVISLVRDHDLDLEELREYRSLLEMEYVVKEVDGRLVSYYPVGTVFLAPPYYLAGMMMGITPDPVDGIARLEKFAAANMGALLAVLFWVLLRRRTNASLVVRIVTWLTFCFGTGNWAVNSQALWQHGPLQICEVLALLAMPVRLEGRRAAVRVAACGLVLGLAGFMRPTGYVLLPVWGLYLVMQNWRFAVPFAGGALLGLLPQFFYNRAYTSGGDTGYFSLIFEGGFFKEMKPLWNMTGLLFSPSRGLLIFTPVLILLLVWPMRGVRRAAGPHLRAGLLAASAAALFAIYLCFKIWWQAYCYGPRFLTDIMPFLMLLLVPVLSWLFSAGRAVAAAATIFAAASMAWSIGVQALGAWRYDGAWEGRRLFDMDKSGDAAWDWRDNIIADTWTGNKDPFARPNPSPSYYTVNPGHVYKMGKIESRQFIASGFYAQEGWGTWTHGAFPAEMHLHFAEGAGTLYLAAMGTGSPFDPARYTFYLNGHRVLKEGEISKNAFYEWKGEVLKIPIKKNYLTGKIERLKIVSHDGARSLPAGRFYGLGIQGMVYLPAGMDDRESTAVQSLTAMANLP